MSAQSAPQLAKLSRPRLRDVVPRTRLYATLDRCRDCPIVWIAAPPGAGKTTLIAGYTSAADRPTLWYLVDAADSDPATFFYYLREAAVARSRRSASRLPLFTPEYRDDQTGFARRFFRSMFATLGPEAALVLDNYQELVPETGLHAALVAAIDEVPQGSRLIVISRTDPPPQYARVLMYGGMGRLDWDDLRLSREETEAVANARGVVDPEAVTDLHDRCGGWMAGLVLIAEQWRESGMIRESPESNTRQTLFEYFAEEILATVPPHAQDILERTALLPRITAATAAAVAGVAEAIDQVDRMYRRRLFTDRPQGTPASYRYHALFRSFLLTRVRSRLPEAAIRALLQQAGTAFADEGAVEDAFSLFIESRDFGSAEQVYIRHAPQLIAQGRWKTLGDWYTALEESAPPDPWVSFWLGRSLTTVEPARARRILETAFAGFRARDEERGALLSGVGIVEALYYEYDLFRSMDPWMERIALALASHAEFADPEESLWVHSVFMVGCAYRFPGHALLPRTVANVEQLLSEPIQVNARVTAATMLHFHGHSTLDDRACRLATRLCRPLLDADELTAQRAALYLGEEGYSHYAFRRYAQALACCDEADRITQRHGLREVEARVSRWRGFCQRRAGLLVEADATIRRLEQLPQPRAGIRAALFDLLRGYVASERGDYQRALEQVLPAQTLLESAGQIQALVIALIVNSSILAYAGRFSDARATLDQAAELIRGTMLDYQRGVIALMRALVASRTGDVKSFERFVGELMSLAQLDRERIYILWYRPVLAEVLGFAAEHGIETESVGRWVREAGMKPVPHASEGWPWPVKIRTLGRFEIRIDDVPLSYGRKAPKRVLELLKLLVAAGGESSDAELIDALFPDLEGDAAHKALGALLHRLRRLLDYPDVVRQKGGRLWLDPESCWTDAGWFERHSATWRDGPRLDAVLDIYRGPFLPGDDALPWVLSARDRLRRCHLEALKQRPPALATPGRSDTADGFVALSLEGDRFTGGMIDTVEPVQSGTATRSRTAPERSPSA